MSDFNAAPFASCSTRLTVSIAGISTHWGTDDALLGAAIHDVFDRYHAQGCDLMLSYIVNTPDGIQSGALSIPAAATLTWEHDTVLPDPISAVAAQVESHVIKFGKVFLDVDGQLIDVP